MRKIVTMIPAGEVYDHDCVRWYRAHDRQNSIEHYHNIGDAFVHDSSLKLLDYDQVSVVGITSVEEEQIARINAECSYVFLRGSNYINSTMEWAQARQVIEKLKIPVIAFGVGAQAPSHGPLKLSDETKKVWRAISERCSSIGVRGSYTAEVLWELGIKNVRIIGCPTAFRRRNPDLRITLPPIEQVKKVGYTLRREVSATYSPDIAKYLQRQRRTILELAQRFDVSVMAQGEIEEKKIVYGNDEQREQAIAFLTKIGWLAGEEDELTKLYRKSLFYSDIVAEYDAIVRQQDLVLGYRLHGNLIALANGIPSVYFTYDSRTSEFVDTFKIPSYDVYSGEEFELERYWEQSLFERFNRAYHQNWREMRTFLEENGVAHRMDGVAAPKLQVA